MNQQDQQQFMQLQQQLQTVMMQKEQLETRKQEINNALDEIEDSDDEELYRSVGMLLINKDQDEIEEELNDEVDAIEMKLKSLERKEDQLKEKVQDAQNQMAQGGQGMDGDDVAG